MPIQLFLAYITWWLAPTLLLGPIVSAACRSSVVDVSSSQGASCMFQLEHRLTSSPLALVVSRYLANVDDSGWMRIGFHSSAGSVAAFTLPRLLSVPLACWPQRSCTHPHSSVAPTQHHNPISRYRIFRFRLMSSLHTLETLMLHECQFIAPFPTFWCYSCGAQYCWCRFVRGELAHMKSCLSSDTPFVRSCATDARERPDCLLLSHCSCTLLGRR